MSAISDAMAALNAAVAAAGPLQGAAPSVLAPVIVAAQNAVDAFDNTITANDPALDASSPDGADISVVVAWMNNTTTEMVDQASATAARGYVGRILLNLELNQN